MTTTKVALITGANKGIGYETALGLGRQGMTVVLGCRDPERGRAAAGALRDLAVDAHRVQLDVTDEKSIADAAQWIETQFGRLDVLVNNAGIVGRAPGTVQGLVPPSETTLDIMREVYETNVVGVVAVTNAMLPLVRQAPAGRIVNVSSEIGSMTSTLDQKSPLWRILGVPYPSSKAALNMVTAMYAKELWDTTIKVNAANPGYCATDFNDNSGFRTAAEGAEAVVHLATLDADGPTGTHYGYVWSTDEQATTPTYAVMPW